MLFSGVFTLSLLLCASGVCVYVCVCVVRSYNFCLVFTCVTISDMLSLPLIIWCFYSFCNYLFFNVLFIYSEKGDSASIESAETEGERES